MQTCPLLKRRPKSTMSRINHERMLNALALLSLAVMFVTVVAAWISLIRSGQSV
jgi:hypothetical protein